ncbi:MAG: undecaprenyl-phosphate galactose phosphotransferase WbaP [Acidobacteriota bacterium]|nr:undecaprenyl-phosphate galactose phosphotransferase WbaP [Acidobacteriota bacterium]
MSAAAVQVVSAPSLPKFASRSWLTGLSVVAADVIAFALNIILIFSLTGTWKQALLQGISALVVFFAIGLYTSCGLNPAREFREILVASTISAALTAVTAMFTANSATATGIGVCISWGAGIALVILLRAVMRGLCSRSSWWGRPTVMFGSGTAARAAVNHVLAHPGMGFKIVAVFDDSLPDWPELIENGITVSHERNASAAARTGGVTHAILALPRQAGEDVQRVLRGEARLFRNLLIIPDLPGISSLWAETRDFGGLLGLHVRQSLLQREARMLKRLCDILIAGSAIMLLTPVFLVIVLAMLISSPGPLFYGHVRIGEYGRIFRAWKFRSMCNNADELLKKHLAADTELRLEWERDHKLRKDPRVTCVGRFLRKTSLDELPQLWNVLCGEMSLVGPRPIVNEEIQRYGDVFDVYKSVKPGITGMWQVSGRNNTTYSERVRFDEYYVTNWSIWLDMYILGRTFKTVLFREGAF